MKLLIGGKRKGRETTKNLMDQHCHFLLKYVNKQDFVHNIIKGAHFCGRSWRFRGYWKCIWQV